MSRLIHSIGKKRIPIKNKNEYIGTFANRWIFQTNTGQSAMGIGAPVICGQNTGQHRKFKKPKIHLCFYSFFTV